MIEEEKDAPEEAKRIRNIRKKINATDDANQHLGKAERQDIKSNKNQVIRFARIEDAHEMERQDKHNSYIQK